MKQEARKYRFFPSLLFFCSTALFGKIGRVVQNRLVLRAIQRRTAVPLLRFGIFAKLVEAQTELNAGDKIVTIQAVERFSNLRAVCHGAQIPFRGGGIQTCV